MSIGLSPPRLVAPINSPVVLLADVIGAGGARVAGSPVQWTLAPGGPGQFVATSQPNHFFGALFAKDRGGLVNTQYATSRTLDKPFTITRLTPTPDDDVLVQPGQAWVMLASPVEGTSVVTVQGPNIADPARRQSMATVHWIDAQWVFPPSTANLSGSPHSLTTTVSRRSDNAPLTGWQVRYEIVGGVAAGFAPDGARVVEVTTNQSGQAIIELMQTPSENGAVQPGSVHVGVQVIRPPLPGAGDARRLILATGAVTKTWTFAAAEPSPFTPSAPPATSAPPAATEPSPLPVTPSGPPALQPGTAQGISLTTTGPERGAVGEDLAYEITVTNTSAAPANDVVVSQLVPAGVRLLSSQPGANNQRGLLTWSLGLLNAGQQQRIRVHYTTGQAGTFNCCASVRTREGLTAAHCAKTTILAPSIDVRINGPETAEVGADVRFEVIVTNRGAEPATGLTITDTFDSGFKHLAATTGSIVRDLGDLQPGESRTIYISFTVVEQGKPCHTVEVVGDQGAKGMARACVTATGRTALEVEKTGPSQKRQGETAEFHITVKNTGNVPLTGILIRDTYDRGLDPRNVSPGYEQNAKGETIDEQGRRTDAILWRVAELAPGETKQVTVQCECVNVTARACNRVTVHCDQHPPKSAEACLEITPREN